MSLAGDQPAVCTVVMHPKGLLAMPSFRTRIVAAAASGVMLGGFAGLGSAGATPGGRLAPTESGRGTSSAPAIRGAQLWAARYSSTGRHFDAASSVAVAPDGRTVFVTGTSADAMVTIAYNAATGARLWLRRYAGPVSGGARASAVTASRDGRTVFVTGTSSGAATGDDYATIAYDAATGARLWLSHYSGPGDRADESYALAFSPSLATVYVTGRSQSAAAGWDYATVAYSASTGARMWVARYTGAGARYDAASSLAVGPDGGRLVVTGTSTSAGTGQDFATVGYSAVTGKQLWVSRYTGGTIEGAVSVAIGLGGRAAFVAGTSDTAATTVAYGAVTGKKLWVRRYTGPGGSGASAVSLAASPVGRAVYVAGTAGRVVGDDYLTMAYDAVSGQRLWLSRYNGSADSVDDAAAMVVAPDGQAVYVTGFSSGGRATDSDYATVAYRAATGAQLWARRYNGAVNGADIAASIAVSPGGRRVFGTGQSTGVRTPAYYPGFDYATVAYGR
jgi:hypothetical protein